MDYDGNGVIGETGEKVYVLTHSPEKIYKLIFPDWKPSK